MTRGRKHEKIKNHRRMIRHFIVFLDIDGKEVRNNIPDMHLLLLLSAADVSILCIQL